MIIHSLQPSNTSAVTHYDDEVGDDLNDDDYYDNIKQKLPPS
jgi:hypothetical protein